MSSTQGPPVIPHEAVVAQKQGQAVLIWAVGAFCIYGWEWIICLPQEYQRIWKKKLTSVSVLYVANRYFGLLQFSFVISLVANAWNPAGCKHAYFWEPVGALISTVLSQMILGARVYAIYAQNLVIGLLLSIVLLVEVVIGGISISTTSPPAPIPGPPNAQPPCGAVMGPFGWLIAFWTIPLFYDTITFFLTAWKAYEYWRKDVSLPLINVIWRDGVLYFFAIFSMNFTNVMIFLTTPKSLRAINLTPTLILSVILSCRLVLNLRDVHAKGRLGFGSSSATKVRTNPTPGRGGSHDKSLPLMPFPGSIEISSSDKPVNLEANRSWSNSFSEGREGYPGQVV